MARLWSRIALAAILAGCAGQSPSTGVESRTVANHFSVRTAILAGVAQAPASVVSNNGSQVISNGGASLVSNNSGGVISNGGATLHLLAAEPWQAVPAAPVTVLDVEEKAIAGVKSATTDASGHFSVAEVPSGSVVTVQVKVGAVVLTSLAMADGSAVQVDPATTIATAQMRALFKGNPAGLAHASLTGFKALVSLVQDVLKNEDVPIKLESPAAVQLTFQAVTARHPEIAAKAQAMASPPRKAGDESSPADVPTLAPLATPTPKAGGTPTPTPAATPTPLPGASPTPAGTPTPTIVVPSPSPGQTPTPVPTATQTPTPIGLAAKALLQSSNICRACDLGGLDLKDVVAPGADLTGASLQTADAVGIKLSGAKLGNALLRLAKLGGADLSGADLTNADLTGADLTNANLSNAKLIGANLDSANLAGAKLDGADLSNAKAPFANFSGATTTNAILTGLKLGGATWVDSKHCADGSIGGCN